MLFSCTVRIYLRKTIFSSKIQCLFSSVWKQLDFIIEFAGYRMKQPSIKQLTARPLISQKTVIKGAVLSCF